MVYINFYTYKGAGAVVFICLDGCLVIPQNQIRIKQFLRFLFNKKSLYTKFLTTHELK